MQDTKSGTDGRRALTRMVLTALAIIVAAGVGVYAVFEFTDAERGRELKRWQQRLGIVADSRLADVESWIGSQMAVMRQPGISRKWLMWSRPLPPRPAMPSRMSECAPSGRYQGLKWSAAAVPPAMMAAPPRRRLRREVDLGLGWSWGVGSLGIWVGA